MVTTYNATSLTGTLLGPVKWPLFGNMIEMLASYDKLYDYLLELYLRFGERTFVMVLPLSPCFVFTANSANLEYALKTNFQNYEKGPDMHSKMSDLLGDGIFNADGELWKSQRKTASNIFNVKNFRNSFLTVFKEESLNLSRILEKSADAGTVLDLHNLFHCYTIDSFCRIGFGKNIESMKSHLESGITSIPFAQAFDKSQSIIDARFWNPFWKVTEHLDGSRMRMNSYIKTMDDFAYKVIQDRRADTDNDSYSDLLSRFLNVKRESGEGFKDKELRDIVLNMIIAGRDTTAQALSWTFLNLHQHPDIVAKIRDEISQVLGDDVDVFRLQYEQLKDLKYTKAVFNEALRLHPSVPNQAKECMKDDVWPDGTVIRKGSWIAMSAFVMGRLKNIWGDDAADFNPDRFLADQTPSQFKFMAFNAGPRLCLGMSMAYLEAVLALVVILSQFDISVSVPVESIAYGSALTLPMRTGLPVHVKRRQNSV